MVMMRFELQDKGLDWSAVFRDRFEMHHHTEKIIILIYSRVQYWINESSLSIASGVTKKSSMCYVWKIYILTGFTLLCGEVWSGKACFQLLCGKMLVVEMGGWLSCQCFVKLLLNLATNLEWQEKSRQIFGTEKPKIGQVRFALLCCCPLWSCCLIRQQIFSGRRKAR